MPDRRRLVVVFAACVLGLACVLVSLRDRPASADVLAAADGLRWYRGNLHTHSLWSDGDDYLEMIALWYKDREYDFLCFTDHNVLPTTERWIDIAASKGGQKAFDQLKARFPDWVEERMQGERHEVRLRTFQEVVHKVAEPGRFLLIQGEEISDRFEKYPIHLNASNVQEVIPPMRGDSVYDVIQNNVNAVLAQRERTGQPILVHLNHPNFGYAVTAEDLMRVVGERFCEVYNGHPGVHNAGDHEHASTERIWDVVLTWRLADLGLPVMYGIAVDDGHNYHNIPSRASEPGRGWVQVLADELTPQRLIDALEAGRFYASSGTKLEKVVSSPHGLDVEVAAEPGASYTIEFIGTRRGFDPSSSEVTDKDGQHVHTTRRYSNDVGAVFSTVRGSEGSYRFGGDELYVRARITSSKPHPNPSEPGESERAWCQPVVGPAAPK